jgi:hypothetical protein
MLVRLIFLRDAKKSSLDNSGLEFVDEIQQMIFIVSEDE